MLDAVKSVHLAEGGQFCFKIDELLWLIEAVLSPLDGHHHWESQEFI